MLHVHNIPNGKSAELKNKDLGLILDALLHEIERYNSAEALITDPETRSAINKGKQKVYNIYKTLCPLVYDPEI